VVRQERSGALFRLLVERPTSDWAASEIGLSGACATEEAQGAAPNLQKLGFYRNWAKRRKEEEGDGKGFGIFKRDSKHLN
jgi:hypothetical protein